MAFLRICAVLACAALIAGCSTAGNSGSAGKARIDMAALSGWEGDGREGIYLCSPPQCSHLRFALFQLKSGFGSKSLFTNIAENRSEITRQFRLGFKIAGTGRSGSLEPDGPVEAFTTKSGIKGALMPIKGTEKDGSPRDPGVMIILPVGNKVAYFIGISKTKRTARQSASAVANALRL